MTKLQSKAIALLMVLGSVAIFLLATNAAFAQTTGAVAGSQSASGAQAGAVGIMINPATPAGGVGTTGFSGSGGTSNTSTLSPVGVGVGGSSGASSNSNASPTIVVGSGNTYEASDLSKRVPGVWAPALTNSNGTCMGSFSSGVGVSGFGGSFGKTYTSAECNARFNANQMNALGAQGLAVEIMCGMDSVYEADQRMRKPVCKPREETQNTEAVSWFPIDDQDAPVDEHEVAMMFPGTNTPIVRGGKYEDMGMNR